MTMPAFTDGTVPHAAALNSVTTGVNGLGTLVTGGAPNYTPCVHVFLDANTPIPNAADTLVTFGALAVNDDNMWVAASNMLVVNTPGVYVAASQIHFDVNGTGERFMHLLLNGASVTANCVAAASQNANGNAGTEGNAMMCMSPALSLAAGASLYLSVFQSSGAALNLTTIRSACNIGVWLVGQ